MMISSVLNNIDTCLPTLSKDINVNKIRKYTKHGIFSPDETDLKYIEKMKKSGMKILTIIESNMYYKDKKLDIVNYIYISHNYVPTPYVKGIKIEAIVVNKTWKIEKRGIVGINEINGNLVRVF